MLYPSVKKSLLRELYVDRNLSMMQISKQLGCSHHKIAYWMNEYKIERRSRSQASYLFHNPKGDPFTIKQPSTTEEKILYGVGLGLYWGEGTKANRNAVRLGNTDPALIRIFIRFLTELCGVNIKSLRFFIQIFSDVNPEEALAYWVEAVSVPARQFYRPIVTPSGAVGNYRVKNKYGVVTIYFGNTKLRNWLVKEVADIAQG